MFLAHISLEICVPLPGKRISLVTSVPLTRKTQETHIPSDMCSLPTSDLTSEIRHQTINIRRLTSDILYQTYDIRRLISHPGIGTRITRGFCVTILGGLYLERLIHGGAYFQNFTVCFLSKGAHITRDTCFLGRGTCITGEMCFLSREHISLGICFLSGGTHMTRDTVKFRKYVPGLTLHYITLHYITLHYIILDYITLHCTALHCTALHCTALHCITLHYNTLLVR